MLSGIVMASVGYLRLGSVIKFTPYPVTVGFTVGVAVVIFASQIKDLVGLTLSAQEPGALVPKLAALMQALPTVRVSAAAAGLLTIAIIGLCRRFRPHWPGMLIAVVAVSALGYALGMPLDTIGLRFGGIPQTLPVPSLPAISFDSIAAVVPAALSFALLGSIESLLSATVADSMTGARHRSNTELVAQGLANIGSALFGGFCVTGTIARTAANIRAGARGPVAGMLHALFLFLFMFAAAPLAKFLPLAALAGVLAAVCWSMAERSAFSVLLRSSRGDAAVLLATFLLTIFHDLTAGILGGFGLGTLVFLSRIAKSVEIERAWPGVAEDPPVNDTDAPYNAGLATDPNILVYRISGAFFFGTAASVASMLHELAERRKVFILDFSLVPLLDSTAAATLDGFTRKASRAGALVYVTGVAKQSRRALMTHGVRPPRVRFRLDIASAIAFARKRLGAPPPAQDESNQAAA